jgi:hypothetical protein
VAEREPILRRSTEHGVGGMEVRLVSFYNESVWIHERHLFQKDPKLEYALQHGHIPYTVFRIQKTEKKGKQYVLDVQCK